MPLLLLFLQERTLCAMLLLSVGAASAAMLLKSQSKSSIKGKSIAHRVRSCKKQRHRD